MNGFKVSDGFNLIHTENAEDAELVAKYIRYSMNLSGELLNFPIAIEAVEFSEIPEDDRRFVAWLRDIHS